MHMRAADGEHELYKVPISIHGFIPLRTVPVPRASSIPTFA